MSFEKSPATIAENARALSKLFARLAGSRDAPGSKGRGELAYGMRVHNHARVTYAAATPAVRKVSGARKHPVTIADNANALSYLFARLAGSRDANKAAACTLARLRVNL
jgi:hypothetical protein